MKSILAILGGMNIAPDAVSDLVKMIEQKKETHALKKDETPWADAVEGWLSTQTSKETRRKYKRRIWQFYDWVTKNRHEVVVVGDVTREDAEEYVKFLETEFPSASTKKNYFWCVKSMFSHQKENSGQQNGQQPVINPFYKVREPKAGRKDRQTTKKKHEVLVRREVDAIIANAHSDDAKAFLTLLYFFALRNAEACRIEGRHLQYVYGEGNKEHIILSGLQVKGKEGDNIIGEGHIVQRKVYQKRAIDVLAPYCGTDGFLFTGSRGKDHIGVRTGFNWVKRAAIAAEIRKYATVVKSKDGGERQKDTTHVSPHWLRHACASVLRHNGASIESISEFLGHASVKITHVYLHADPEMSAKTDY